MTMTPLFQVLSSIDPDELKVVKMLARFKQARESWGEFESLVHELIISASNELSSSRNHLKFDQTSEDGYSDCLLMNLKGYEVFGLHSSRETNEAGHCDISIRIGKYKWLGEAKKSSSYPKIYDGFLQLCTRYSTCCSNSKSGGLIIYCNRKRVDLYMNRWIAHLKSSHKSIVLCNDHEDDKNIKFTTHTHDVSGNQYKVIHLPVYLNYDPKK